jgi:hypothetical protein
MQERRNGPLVFILAERPGIRRDASFDRQSVLAQAFRLREFMQNFERLFSGEHRGSAV